MKRIRSISIQCMSEIAKERGYASWIEMRALTSASYRKTNIEKHYNNRLQETITLMFAHYWATERDRSNFPVKEDLDSWLNEKI